MTTAVSLSAGLCGTTLDNIVQRLSLQEVGEPFLTLSSPMSPDKVGQMRIFTGEAGGPVAKAVYVGLVVPQIGLDSHMTFAFASADSALPHFTLDSVMGQSSLAFHLDLIPRAELGTHVSYMDAVYAGITDTFTAVRSWEGLTPAQLSPRQIAMMSPWMLVNRATDEAFAAMSGPVGAYRDHWYSLIDSGLPGDVVASLSNVDLAARDAEHRHQLFSVEVDPVWHQVERLVGDEQMEAIRSQLLTNEVVGA